MSTTIRKDEVEPHSKPIGRYAPMRARTIGPSSVVVTISGQVAVDAQGAVRCPGDPEGQADIVFAQLIDLLTRAGGSLTDLQSVTIILSDRAHFDHVNRVRNRVFATHAPASTLIIADLAEAGCLVEVNGFALIDGAETAGEVGSA